MATTTCVGLQSDGYVALDFSEKDGWDFHQLTIAEAKFLFEELGDAIQRAERRFPDGTPKEDEDEESEPELPT